MKSTYSLFVLVSLALAGCAFKEKSVESASSGAQAAAPLSITLSWQDGNEGTPGERSDKRQLRKTADQLFWTWDAPLQLPPKVPASLEIRFDIMVGLERVQGLTIEDFVIEGRRGRADTAGGFDERFRPLKRASTLEVGSSQGRTDVSFAKIRIEDLGSLFSEHEQGVLEIRISARDASGNWISRYLGKLRTPPSLITFKQMRLAEFEAGGRPLDRAIKRIRTQSVQLDMIQVTEIKNATDSAVEIDFSNHLADAQLATRVESYTYVDKGCDYEVRHADEQPSYTDAIYLAALKTLDPEVAFIGDNPGAAAVQTLHMEPGETAWIGIYGTGGGLPALLDNGHPRSDLSRTRIQGRCFWQCGSKSNYVWWFKDENQGHPHVQECRACEGGNIDSCNSCHTNEPVALSSPQTYCFAWSQVRQQLDVDLGTRTYPVDLKISATANRFQLRWPEASEWREVAWPFPMVRQMD